MATVSLKNIQKIYDNKVQAVFDFNLDIEDNEFIVFVGPSGCGKSTTIRMIAGLEDISDGELYINDKLVNDVNPKDRDIAMVFQSYALYPHMNVYENMAFALKLKKVDKDEIDKRVKDAAEILGLTDYLKRKPKALSGGQRQRVALGRAIVRDAKIFLMDEPLSNLDAKLRGSMRTEIIKLHERLKTTTIYVTHDQTEAMTMATRIVVMKDGYIQQIGTPSEIYNKPTNMFVAGFVGSPAMNFISGKYENKSFSFGKYKMDIPKMFHSCMEAYEGKDVIFGIRPEDIHEEGIVANTYPSAHIDFEVDVRELLGHESVLHGKVEGQNFIAKVNSRLDIKVHSSIDLAFDLSKAHFFDPQTTEVIIKENC